MEVAEKRQRVPRAFDRGGTVSLECAEARLADAQHRQVHRFRSGAEQPAGALELLSSLVDATLLGFDPRREEIPARELQRVVGCLEQRDCPSDLRECLCRTTLDRGHASQ